jgi:hypothetical protein
MWGEEDIYMRDCAVWVRGCKWYYCISPSTKNRRVRFFFKSEWH